MADDDLDLDAMLDSALDEGFAKPSGNDGQNVDDADIDLDSMLDDVLISTEASCSTSGSTGIVQPASARPSAGFGPSKHFRTRRQGGGGTVNYAPFRTAERQQYWKNTMQRDVQRQEDIDPQRPLSRAYRSFYPSKEEGGIVVHLGSGASDRTVTANGNTERSETPVPANDSNTFGEDPVSAQARTSGTREESENAAHLFEDVLGRGVANSNVKDPPSMGEGDEDTLDRLKVSYLRLVIEDVRSRVANDPDVDKLRFPGIASKILS